MVFINFKVMKYKMITTLVALIMTTTSFAQSSNKDYEVAPYGFVGIQGGMHNTWSNPGTRDWKPVFGLQGGYFFTEVFGLRLQGTYSKWSVDLTDGTDYDASRLGIDLDMLFNFSNLFFPGRHNLIDVIGIAGVPFELAVPHTKLDVPATAENSKYTNWKTGWKGGGMVRVNLAKNWAVDLEGGTNFIAKRTSDNTLKSRWWPYLMAGITYKFGHKSTRTEAPVVAPRPVEPTPQPVVEKKPEPVVQKTKEAPKTNAAEVKSTPKPVVKVAAKTTQNVFFDLGKADIKSSETQKINEVAEWAKQHSDATIMLTGYADAETGNAELNKELSERRAAAVKDALVKKGVSANRIKSDSKGDTVQPFSENDMNRAVIIIGQGK